MGVPNGFTVKKQPEDGAVVVVTRKQLNRHLQHLPVRLSERDIESIFDVAIRSTTWTS